MRKILNASNHVLGLNQIEELQTLGYDVVELSDDLKRQWGQLNPENYARVCNDVIEFAETNGCTALHLAGFPAAVTLICMDVNEDTPVYYAYSEREVIEVSKEDGSVEKKAVFKHKGFFRYVTSKKHIEAFK